SVATSLLNARGRFGASAIAPLAYNGAIILAAVTLAPNLGVTGLAIGVVAGSVCHLLVQLGPLRRTGYRYSPSGDLGDCDARRTQVVSAVFDWGRFTGGGVDLTAAALVVLIVALPSESLTALLARAFYADRDTTVPVVAAVLAVAINTTVAIAAVGSLGVAGI